jgi:TusA-related sulfurtransferase
MTTTLLDITKDHCPMTFVKVKLQLAKLGPGDVLDVLLSEGEPLVNVPKSAQEQGNRIVEIRKDGENFHVVIEKGKE